MTQNAQRQSQVVSMFGPGAMVGLTTRCGGIAGLERWDMRGQAVVTIPEPRLTARLEQLLKQQGRLAQEKHLTLRVPPSGEAPNGIPRGIDAPVFPTWFVCERAEIITVG